MDQCGEKEAVAVPEGVHGDDAAAVPEGVHGESSTDQCHDGGLEAETAGVIVKEQVEVVIEGEASAAPLLLAHACSLLQQLLLLLRACARCQLVGLLHTYCSDKNGPKPAADDNVAAAGPVAESSTQEGEGTGGDDDKAADSEVASQVLAATRPPPPPGPPEEGSGGHGGNHN